MAVPLSLPWVTVLGASMYVGDRYPCRLCPSLAAARHPFYVSLQSRFAASKHWVSVVGLLLFFALNFFFSFFLSFSSSSFLKKRFL